MRFAHSLPLRGFAVLVLVCAAGISLGGCFASCDNPGSASCEEYCGLHCSNDGAPAKDCATECARIEPLNEQSACDDEFDAALDCLGAAPKCGEVECLGPVAGYESCVLDYCMKNSSNELCKSASTTASSASSSSGSGGSGGGGGAAGSGCDPITGADGRGEVLAAGETNPEGIALLDGERVYWTAQGAVQTEGAIRAVALSGGKVEDIVTGQSAPTHLALVGGALYWTNGGTSDGSGYLSDGAVMTLPAGGTTPTALATSQKIPAGLAVGGGFVYWVNEGTTNLDGSVYNDNGSIARVPIGGGATKTLADGASLRVPFQVAVDGTSVYWSEIGMAPSFSDGHLRAVPLGGGAAHTVDGQPANGVVVDNGFVYWAFPGTEEAGFADGGIVRIPTSGGDRTVLAAGVCRPSRVAVDGSHVYWSSRVGGAVYRVAIAGGTPELLASGLARPANLAVDATHVYWTSNGTEPGYTDGAIMRLAK